MAAAIPAIERAHDRDPPCIRCPDGEADPSDALMPGQMRAETMGEITMAAFGEKMQVEVAKDQAEPIDILGLPSRPPVIDSQQIRRLGREQAGE